MSVSFPLIMCNLRSWDDFLVTSRTALIDFDNAPKNFYEFFKLAVRQAGGE